MKYQHQSLPLAMLKLKSRYSEDDLWTAFWSELVDDGWVDLCEVHNTEDDVENGIINCVSIERLPL